MFRDYISDDLSFPKRAWVEINLDAISHNFSEIYKRNGIPVMPVIKANGYGHGAVRIAKLLEEREISCFAVSNIDEAQQLRDNGITADILILGYTPVECAKKLNESDLTQCIYSLTYAEELNKEACRCKVKIKCHLKLDTGMGRIGFDCRDASLNGLKEAVSALSCEGLEFNGVFTHFAVADSLDTSNICFTHDQYSRFDAAIKELKKQGFSFKLRHCDNSAAILEKEHKLEDTIRAGIILYGLNPSPELGADFSLRPAMSFYSVVSMIKEVAPGATISYGRTYKAEGKRLIATVTAGYADGVPRLLSNKGQVIINGSYAPIVGNICMDQFCVDVTDIGPVKIGDTVTIWGKGISVEEIADYAGTINYEIICGVSPRVPRIYIKSR